MRTALQSVTTQTVSLMPTGFESALDRPAMADLLAWLRND
jgi:hypothetical protein